ncbi:MAG: hypothetical protein COW88_00025 [Candidatus Lloydbacteria bacterium CG22_combo_CG10-13_8_21_14_all_47_15]|uniref:50S ribosomal protein L35 n=1 Tax=Candidatus Lloydbacteria bacterium CG22_combo_CG10-13_8_21_14_all_47_15 TaxID=1974635 RepID=A0A2H0CW19_9BACT|nr:MAG: hypothetical protein COW88_00025 [Candidatus Lloydbacteria bacterium CG22_combo_CG10-13_8_21_14_all_47_15]
MKTNKSYTKRLRVTRTGKLMGRKPGQDHFNAKQSGTRNIAGKRQAQFTMGKKARGRFLPGV